MRIKVLIIKVITIISIIIVIKNQHDSISGKPKDALNTSANVLRCGCSSYMLVVIHWDKTDYICES